VAASQSRAVPSPLPVKTMRPSGLKATPVIRPRCGKVGRSIGAPVAASQRRALSSPAVRIRRPSGLKTAAVIGPACTIGRPARLPGGGVPEPARPARVVQEQAGRRGLKPPRNLSRSAAEGAPPDASLGSFPELNGLSLLRGPARRQENTAVRPKGHCIDLSVVRERVAQRGARCGHARAGR